MSIKNKFNVIHSLNHLICLYVVEQPKRKRRRSVKGACIPMAGPNRSLHSLTSQISVSLYFVCDGLEFGLKALIPKCNLFFFFPYPPRIRVSVLMSDILWMSLEIGLV